MLSPVKTMASIKAASWANNLVGTLLIWKLGKLRFQAFHPKDVQPHRVAADVERVILEAMIAMANPPYQIEVKTLTEVEVLACDSQEAIMLHHERTQEVDYMIDYIDAVERVYWGNRFM